MTSSSRDTEHEILSAQQTQHCLALRVTYQLKHREIVRPDRIAPEELR